MNTTPSDHSPISNILDSLNYARGIDASSSIFGMSTHLHSTFAYDILNQLEQLTVRFEDSSPLHSKCLRRISECIEHLIKVEQIPASTVADVALALSILHIERGRPDELLQDVFSDEFRRQIYA